MVVSAFSTVELFCLKTSDDSGYCVESVLDTFSQIGSEPEPTAGPSPTRPTNAAITATVNRACTGDRESCPAKISRTGRKLFQMGIVAGAIRGDDDEANEGPGSFLASIEQTTDIMCLRAGNQYCVPQLADQGIFDGDDDDEGDDTDDDADEIPDNADIALTCSPCGRAFTSVAAQITGDRAPIEQQYGCGRRQSDNQWCIAAGVNASIFIQQACFDSTVLFPESTSNTCSAGCSQAIATRLTAAQCCSDMALVYTLQERSNSRGTPSDLASYKTRIASSCSNVTASTYPATCQGPTPAGLKIRLNNIKPAYFTGNAANRAALEQRVCRDVTAQVGARADQCSVTEVAASGSTGVILTLNLRLETDAASTAARDTVDGMSASGTLRLGSTDAYLAANAANALADPTLPASSQAQDASDGDDFDDDPLGADDDFSGGSTKFAARTAVTAVMLAIAIALGQ